MLKIKGKVIFGNEEFSNQTVLMIIEGLKNQFLLEHNINEGDVVAVFIDRSPQMLFAIYALFEAGIPFLMLNEDIPVERMNYMLQEACVNTLITSRKNCQKLCVTSIIQIDELFGKINSYHDLAIRHFDSEIAYILFTSGSTGNPKGVQVKRKGLINFINSVSQIVNIDENTIIGCFTSCTFDIFFLETFLAIYSGANVILGDEETINNTKKLMHLIEKQKINTLQFTPSRLKMIYMLDKKLTCLQGVKTLLIGGEMLQEALLETLQEKLPDTHLFNMYGPTETTIWSSIADLTHEKKVTIGKPIGNTQMYIFDVDKIIKNEDVIEKEIGEIGEICISGDGLAKGYLNNDQTEKAFIQIVINGVSTRIYRTGDLGKIDDDGNYICLGRIDNQIKIDGHRVELEEIESKLNECDAVLNAAVIFDKDNNILISFIIRNPEMKGPVTDEHINKYLSLKVPNYMIPSKIIWVDKLMYTSSGKIDRKGLLTKYYDESINSVNKENSNFDEDIGQIIYLFRKIISNDSIGENTILKELHITSLQFINFVVEVEDMYDVEFEDEKLSATEFETLRDIYDYVNSMK